MISMSLHWFDLAAGLFLLACIAYSSLRGFLKEFFTLLAWAVGYFGSITLHPHTAPFMKKVIKTSLIADLITFFLLFALLYIAVRLIGVFAHKKLGLEHIPAEINHGAGAIIGVAKWAFFVAIFLSPLSLFPSVKEKLANDSIVAELIINSMRQISTKGSVEVPAVADSLKKGIDKFKGAVETKMAIERLVIKEKNKKKEEASKGDSPKPALKKIEPTVKAKTRGKLIEPEESRKKMDKLIESLD